MTDDELVAILQGRSQQGPIAIPQRAAAEFSNLPPLEPPSVALAASQGQPTFPRRLDSLFPGYRESSNVEDRRGRFDDMMYANELDRDWRSSGAAPLMRRY